MKIKFNTDELGTPTLFLGDNAFIEFLNDWSQFIGDWNWITFTFCDCHIEKDMFVGGWEFVIQILGLGLRFRLNDPESEGIKEMNRRIDEIDKSSEEK